MRNLAVSIDVHGSKQIAVVAHHDCAGNPVPDKTQKAQVTLAVRKLRDGFPDSEVIGLWVSGRSIIERVIA